MINLYRQFVNLTRSLSSYLFDKVALQNLTFYSQRFRSTIEIMVLEVALAELLLINILAITIKLVQTIFVYHLTSKRKLFAFVVVNDKRSAYLCNLIEFLTVLNTNQLSYALYPKFILEFEFAFLIKFRKI